MNQLRPVAAAAAVDATSIGTELQRIEITTTWQLAELDYRYKDLV